MRKDETTTTGQATVPPTAPATIDQTTREQLYIANIGNFRDSAYAVYPSMPHMDTERILGKLADRLNRFIVDDGADFLRSAQQYVRNVARHLQRYYSLINDHTKLIYSAIQRSLYGETESWAIEVDDVVMEVNLLMYSMVNALLAPGTAKPGSPKTAALSSRIFALARKHCYYYHVSPRRRQRNAVERRVKTVGDLGGAEFLTEMELRSMAADELEDDVV
jgi:hypothetical protein